ncbi:MAG TPA: ABC transporter permease [Gemmataceae bacterium]|jgi:putative ABC transport system permease protein|nr:ABC transporter permease [Gemmataceae bacterium]
MSFLSAIRVALGALLVNKGRSFLTSLGIVIGISAVIAMVSAGSGARNKLNEQLEIVGKNLILIRAGARTQQGIIADSTPLTTEDANAIRKRVGNLLEGVAESQMTQRLVLSRYGKLGTAIVGSTPDLQRIRNWKMAYGRFYTEEEVKRMADVCLIGQTVRRELFPNKPDPIGESIQVDRVRLHIVGVLAEKGHNPLGADQDNQVFMPITTLRQRLVNEKKIDIILTVARSDDLVEKAKDQIDQVLREQHHIKPGASPDFDVSTVQEIARVGLVFLAVMQTLVVVIALISLVVGGIGIMNIMLVSVTERTREIGIRMAVGATGADVLMQFLIEAVVLALVGGVIGVSLGIGGAIGLALVVDWPVVVYPPAVLLAFMVAAAVGIFFGFYPALKASRLDPIEALRYE